MNAFMRTTEAMLAILLVFTMFSFISERVSAPNANFLRDPSISMNALLETLTDEIKQRVESCDLQRLKYLINSFQFPTMDNKVELSYVSELKMTGYNISERYVSFTFNFPDYVNKNRIALFSETQGYDITAIWNWYKLPIILQNNLSEKNNYDISLENINLSKPNVLNNTLIFYWNNKKTLIDLENISEYDDYTLANFSVRIPHLEPSESGTGYLFFAVDNSSFTQTFAELGNNSLDYTPKKVIDSTRADIYFYISFLNSTETLYLKYEIGTEGTTSYSNFTEFNNTNVNFEIYWNDLKPCSPLEYQQLPIGNYFNVERKYYDNHLSSSINLKMWYPLS